MSSKGPFKLGRLPRAFNPNVPHLSALVAGTIQPAPPATVDYTKGMPEAPNGFGPMLNDALGDCTCAAFYHARQVWTFHSTGKTQTARTDVVKLLYEKACHYNPARPNSDPGGVEQDVLKYIQTHGAPLSASGARVDKILGFVEIDPRNVDDVKRSIYNAGVAYIGVWLTDHVYPDAPAQPPLVWDVTAAKEKAPHPHCVVLPGYDKDGVIVISWGRRYKMTWAYFAKHVDEVYSISDRAWTSSPTAKRLGLSLPGGLSVGALANQMRSM
jgi:hypothetical protein